MIFSKCSMMPGWHHAVSEQAWSCELRRHPCYVDGNWSKGLAKEMTVMNFSNIFVTNLKFDAIFDTILYSENIKGNIISNQNHLIYR